MFVGVEILIVNEQLVEVLDVGVMTEKAKELQFGRGILNLVSQGLTQCLQDVIQAILLLFLEFESLFI